MKINEMQRPKALMFDAGAQSPPNRPGSRKPRRDDRPGIGFALLGAICVIGVFGFLGLLYTFG
jgi:hypothetical protein